MVTTSVGARIHPPIPGPEIMAPQDRMAAPHESNSALDEDRGIVHDDVRVPGSV